MPEFSSELSALHEGPEHRRALLSGLLVAAAGIASTALLYLFIAHLQSQDRSAAALGMADMHMNNMRKFWSFPLLEASGLTGLFFAWAGAMLGLQQSSRALSWLPLSYRQIDRLHRQISLLVLALVGVHVLATMFDAMGDSWKTVLIPGEWGHLGWPQAVWAYDLGIIALYALILVAPTFYVRRLIGTGRWRFIHRFVLVFYVASVWHALILGLDVGHYAWVRPAIWLAQIPLLALFIRRLLQPVRKGAYLSKARQGWIRVSRYGLIASSAVGIAAILLVVVSGRTGFIKTV